MISIKLLLVIVNQIILIQSIHSTPPVQSANILMSLMFQSRSHASTFSPVMRRLAADGHNVTINYEIVKPASQLTFDGSVYEHLIALKNYEDPLLGEKSKQMGEILWKTTTSPIIFPIPYYFTSQACAHLLNDQPSDFWHLANQSWDLVLTDSLFSACGYAISLLNLTRPYVIMHPCAIFELHSYPLALGRNPVVVPPGLIRHHHIAFDVTSFFDRFGSFTDFLTFHVVLIPINYIIRNAIQSVTDRFNFAQYSINAGLHFVDDPYAFSWHQPTGNDIISYGSVCKSGKKLSDEYAEFVAGDGSTSKGTILIAFGTVTDWTTAPASVIDAFVNALNNLSDYRIIWGYKGDRTRITTKSHVLLREWVPQVELLEHVNTRLFISHGGLKRCNEDESYLYREALIEKLTEYQINCVKVSTMQVAAKSAVKEAICSRTPVLYMPMFAEQVRNAFLASRIGFGEFVNKLNVSSDELETKIRKILNDDRYQQTIDRLRQQFDDRVSNPLDVSAFWFRKLLQLGGRFPDYFYRFGIQLGAFAYFGCDIAFVAVSMLTIVTIR